MAEVRRILTLEPNEAREREVGVWLRALEEARRGTLRAVDGVDRDLLDWRGESGTDNSIGTLLTHIAAVEVGWVYFDVLLHSRLPDDFAELMPYEKGWDDQGRLLHVSDELGVHLRRLEVARRHLLERFGEMELAEWHRVRSPEDVDYSVTPSWVAYHLVEHEAGHLFQIRSMKRRWKQVRGQP